MKFYRILLLVITIITNYYVFDFYYTGQKLGSNSSLGVAFYQLGSWLIGILIALLIFSWIGFKNLQKIDYVIFATTTPLTYIILSLFLK